MLNWFKRVIHAASAPAAEPMSLRRWGAAKTNRLNRAHWQPVTGQTINQDLAGSLETLRTRCEFEVANNPDAEGMIFTHTIDVIGAHGPTLQVQSDNEAYSDKLEAIWSDWWSAPDVTGKLSGVDLLDLDVRKLWTAGEFLTQIVTDKSADGPVQMRLKVVNPRRLASPAGKAADPRVVMGIELDDNNKPVRYYIDNTSAAGLVGTSPEPVPAADIIHEFDVIEEDQARGVPKLATCVQIGADLRDYDLQVMDAARAAADSGVFIWSIHPNLEPTVVKESSEIERRMNTTLPPGYQATQLTPQQPATGYTEFHDEHLRRLGRPCAMPLMITKLDSKNHNYSSARFDAQVYNRGIDKFRGWLERRLLNRLVAMIAREAELAGRVGTGGGLPARPATVKYKWTWPRPASVDPTKDASAASERLANGTSTHRDECAANGEDWAEVFDQQAKEQEKRDTLGLPRIELSKGKLTGVASPRETASEEHNE